MPPPAPQQVFAVCPMMKWAAERRRCAGLRNCMTMLNSQGRSDTGIGMCIQPCEAPDCHPDLIPLQSPPMYAGCPVFTALKSVAWGPHA